MPKFINQAGFIKLCSLKIQILMVIQPLQVNINSPSSCNISPRIDIMKIEYIKKWIHSKASI